MARLAAAAHTKTGSLAHNLTSFLSTLGGMKNYTLFGETATFVDPDQPPGHSPQPQSWSSWLRATLTLTAFVHSPNLSWCLIAMGVYILFPYNYTLCRDLTSSSTQSFGLRRTLLHTLVVGSYYTFWFVSLYYKGCGKRKFRGVPSTETAANSTPSPTMATKTNTPPTTYVPPEQLYPSLRSMAHNLYYWALGILQFVCWETCFVHLYATNKISAGNGSLVLLVLGTILVPVWRGMHFYFSHRFLHIRPIYRYVHSLHHRNVDIEPFAGLTMHPVEHLYYFACLAPSLWWGGSPFLFLFNGYHLLLSPAASHSGWEDHFQSDQFHYLHHAKFECNYGSASMPFDFSNGTHQNKFNTGTSTLKKKKKRPRKKSSGISLLVWTAWQDVVPATFSDFIYSMAMLGLSFLLFNRVAGDGQWSQLLSGQTMGLLVGFGPVALSVVLRFCVGDSLSIRWPFHKENIVGRFGFHCVVGVLFTCWPTYQTVELVLKR